MPISPLAQPWAPSRQSMCCSTAYMHDRAGVRPVITDARVGAQIGLPEYARSNQAPCGDRDMASRCGVSAGPPVRLQSPQPMSSAIMSTIFGNGEGDASEQEREAKSHSAPLTVKRDIWVGRPLRAHRGRLVTADCAYRLEKVKLFVSKQHVHMYTSHTWDTLSITMYADYLSLRIAEHIDSFLNFR